MKCILDNMIVAILHFFGVTMVLWIWRRMSVFSRCMLKHLDIMYYIYKLCECSAERLSKSDKMLDNL